jgi:enolase-phosphatase E1
VHPLEPKGGRVILLDVEGTTAPTEFIYETLFPYARENLRAFLLRHQEDPTVRADIEALRRQYQDEDPDDPDLPVWNKNMPVNSTVNYSNLLMDRDSKATALKSLQGRVLLEGYVEGRLRGEVFPDVRPGFERWTKQGRGIAIFSSGSVLAQKLLFTYTTVGDLSRHLKAYFDTTIGGKRDIQSYHRIAGEMALSAGDMLFLSDAAEELDAARAAGLGTALCVRSGDPPANPGGHSVIRSFDDLFP